ncbi:MAG: hypothetical protein IT264_15985 [Saprospiraceae bacterium]|nr:hypothetical protein [Saprospiraceae bacterium]
MQNKNYPDLQHSPIESRHYPAKILLVGEYGLLYGGEALSMPYPNLGGSWDSGQNNFPRLDDFCDYLDGKETLIKSLDLNQFRQDLENGLYFNSNIPQSYGLGSSGCLCAAVADRYGKNLNGNPALLRDLFIQMESFFHGSSSGLDPLVSYLNKPLHLIHEGEPKVLDNNIVLENEGYHISLVDSGIPRNTKEWVKLFKALMQDPEYHRGYSEKMLHANKNLIEAFISQNNDHIIQNWQALSELSFCYFYKFIPDGIKYKWEKGIQDRTLFYKLCGAGGGGFFLALEIKK